MAPVELQIVALTGLPSIQPGDDLCGLICSAVQRTGMTARDGDIFVVAQKVISKAESRLVPLSTVKPGDRAKELAAITGKDPRLVELILRESHEVLRVRSGVMIVLHRLGIVCAKAGIDFSNVGCPEGEEVALILPENPDVSASRLRQALCEALMADVGVIINDSVGRAWRLGTVGLAIGGAGLPGVEDLRGLPDLYGRPLQVSQTGIADAIASAAILVQGEAAEGRPVALIRGFDTFPVSGCAADLLRPAEEDLFR